MFDLITNYLYMYHTGQFIILPSYPDTITDSLGVNFNSENPMLRSAPIFSYSNSGPRTIDVTLTLQRDLISSLNVGKSNLVMEIGDDYVDTIIKQIQSIALPRYASGCKMVDPPIIAVRFGNEIFIKGVVMGSISTRFEKPIIKGDKYEVVTISFTVSEITPYDALSVQQNGLMRGLNTSLERKIYRG